MVLQYSAGFSLVKLLVYPRVFKSRCSLMADAYLKWVNSTVGSRLAGWLGLPRPVHLRRFESGQPVIDGEVLVAAGGQPQLLPVLAQSLARIGARTLAHGSVHGWTAMLNHLGQMSGPWSTVGANPAKVKAVVFDATGLRTIADAESLHTCFSAVARSIDACGRVVVLGRLPQECDDPGAAMLQRGLEGLVRSLGKELKRGITAQTVYVGQGAEQHIEGVLRFLLSPRSAYVSGQVLRLQAAGEPALIEWSQPLAGRQIMVTGAARGIGAAIATTLARDGARVICVDVPQAQDALAEVAARLQGRAVPLDITQTDAAQRLVSEALADGAWDGVVHNAGITRDKTMARMSIEHWRTLMQVNLAAPHEVTRALLDARALKNGARLVAVSSISGIAGNPGQTNYAYSKAGLIGLVQAMAPTLAAQGMAINAVAPGFIETQMTAAIPWAIREAGRRMNALGQGGQPQDVAEAIAWLLSPASAGVQGQVLRVCGLSLLGA
jgi:3-oxoacyl-[acyl-carrier protein] reductase